MVQVAAALRLPPDGGAGGGGRRGCWLSETEPARQTAPAGFLHLFEHALHIHELFEQAVDILHIGTGAAGDAAFAAGIDDFGFAALGEGHGTEDGLGAFEAALGFLRVYLGGGPGHLAWQHAQQLADGAEFAHLLELFGEVFKGEFAGEHFLGAAGGLFGIQVGFGFFNQAEHIAHAKDAPGQAGGVEDFQAVEVFADAEVFDGHAGNAADADGGAAAGIAIQFGEGQAGEGHGGAEALGYVDGFLADHRVDDEEGFGGGDVLLDGFEFGHEGVIQLAAPGGIQNDDGVAAEEAFFLSGLGQLGWGDIRLVEDFDADFLAEGLKLLDGGGAVGVGGGEEDALALAAQEFGEFGGGGGFAGALQADEHKKARLGAVEGERGDRAEGGDEFLMDDFDDLLGGVEGGGDFVADGASPDALDEVLDDAEVDIGFEEGQAHFAQGGIDLGFAEAGAAAQVFEDLAEALGEGIKHGVRLLR